MGAGASLGLAETDEGLVLRALGLWLDPVRPTPAAFVSHAHATAGGERALASPETIALAVACGRPIASAPQALGWREPLEMPIDEAFGGGTARLTIAPAGHLPGAAQLVIDHPRGRLVYTGDWSREGDPTHAGGDAVACDEIVLTSTFALPIFRFAPPAVTTAALVTWCAARLAEGTRPVVLAQTPGPAQSIVHALAAAGLPVEMQEEVRRGCEAYEALGIALGSSDSTEPVGKAVQLAPASAGGRRRKPAGSPARGRSAVAYASGWARLDAAVEQKRADAAFAIADQADFDGLVALVAATGARRVLVTRGDARAFASFLRSRGVEADAVELPPIDDRGAS
jgi:putative mRNA 3-end processing factor